MGLLQQIRNRGWQIRDSMRRMAHMKRVARENASFDKLLGTDTAGFKSRREYDLPAEELETVTQYEPVNETGFRTIVDCVLPDTSGHAFIDIGSGKGKALLMAATYDFHKVVGVELDEPLHRIAERNIATARRNGVLKCADVSSVKMDARRFDDYPQNSFVFIFNPFDADIMDAYVRHLSAQVREKDLSVLLVYLNPRHADCFHDADVFEELLRLNRLAIYATKGAAIDPENRRRLINHFSNWR